MKRTTIVKLLGWLAVVALLLLLPVVIITDPYKLRVLTMTCFWVILAVTLRATIQVNIWNFGVAAFCTTGAYSGALAMKNLGLDFWPALLVAGLFTALVAAILGAITIRIRAIYFTIVTLAFNEVVRLVIVYTPSLGGVRGVKAIPPVSSLGFGPLVLDFRSDRSYYYLVLAIAAVTILFLRRLERSRIGEAIRCVATNEQLSESVGLDTARYKIALFAVSSFFVGLAGAFYGPYITAVGPAAFNLWTSFSAFIMVVVGGSGSLLGPIVGAAFMTALPEFLNAADRYRELFQGIVFVLIMIFLPNGLISLPTQPWLVRLARRTVKAWRPDETKRAGTQPEPAPDKSGGVGF